MASCKKLSLPLLLRCFFFFLLLLFCTFPTPATAISTTSLDSLLFLLRSHSHTLFANAIATSDLLFDLLSLPSLTLFAPPNPSLFALDMTLTPPFYISTLRLHVTPSLILSFPNSSSSIIHTLLPSRHLHLTTDHLTGNPLVDGVEILLPPLYHSRNVAVYSLRSMLPSRDLFNPVPLVPSPRNHRNRNNNSNNRTVPFSPVSNGTVSPPVTVNIPVMPPPPVNFTTISPLIPANGTVLGPPPDNITIAFPSPQSIPTTAAPSNLTNSTCVSPVPSNLTFPVTPVSENHTVLTPQWYSPAASPNNLEARQEIPLAPVPVNHTVLAPHSSSPADSPKDFEFLPVMGDYDGFSVTEKDCEHKVSANEKKEKVGKCGPSDEETVQCSVRDEQIGLGDVSKFDDYVVRHQTTDYTL